MATPLSPIPPLMHNRSDFARHYLKSPELYWRTTRLGSLSDNILTIGKVAGRFLCCEDCGQGMATASLVLECGACGAGHDLKPDSSFKPRSGGPVTRLLTRRLSRARAQISGHWFLVDENWSVAEFFVHLTTVDTETLLRGLLGRLGIEGELGALEEILHWPRLWFGKKRRDEKNTIQPDVVLVFERRIVSWEFKRPKGGSLPAHELAGQAAFLSEVEEKLGVGWNLVVVPGPERAGPMPLPSDLASGIREGQNAALEKWNYGAGTASRLSALSVDELAGRITCLSWERLLREALREIDLLPDSWNKRAAIRGLGWFHRERSDVFAPLAPS